MDKTLLLIIFLLVKSIYLPLNKRKSKYYWKIKIDDYIPFIPIFIIPYIGYFFYILATIILLWNTKLINTFFMTYITSYVVAELFWYFVPNGVKRPIIDKKDIFSKLVKNFYRIDDDTNGFPSAHVFGTLICSYFLLIIFPQQSLLIWLISFLINFSTVLVKQHYILDILGGFIIFGLSVIISGLFGKI